MQFISPRTHSILGMIVGIALLLAPNIFGFGDLGGAAVLIPRILGVIVILSELIVRGGFAGIDIVPMSLHIATDVVMGAFLAISPWVFGFINHSANAWLPHLLVGVLMMGYALATRTSTEDVMARA